MIKNEKQYQVTSKKLVEFKKAVEKLKGNKEINPILQEIQIGALQAQIEIFEEDIAEYTNLKNKEINHVYVDSLSNLHQALIKARISKGWTQFDLAEKLHLKEQQIQRYEAYNYETASLPRIQSIADELGIQINPIKVTFKETNFELPSGLSKEVIEKAQNKLKQERTLLVLQ